MPATLSIPPRNDDPTGYWKRVDNMFYSTVGRAQTAFRVNIAINIIIVIVGLALVGVGLYSTIVKGADFSSLTFAGVGAADLVTTFFANPQKGVQKSLDNLASIQAAYQSYLVELEHWTDLQGQLNKAGQLTVDVTDNINEHISQLTEDTIKKITGLSAEIK